MNGDNPRKNINNCHLKKRNMVQVYKTFFLPKEVKNKFYFRVFYNLKNGNYHLGQESPHYKEKY